MAVTHTFKYSVPEGKEFIRFEDWIASLSPEEQSEFHAAKTRQEAYRQEAIDRGDLVRDFSTVDPKDPTSQPSYVWRDEETAKKNKPSDEIWRNYWDRWIKEVDVQFDIVETKIN